MDKNGESRISMEDFAVAMLDEAKTPRQCLGVFAY